MNTNYTQDTGNNESLTRGVFPQGDGTFLAMTFTASKPFKTRRGAVKWLAVGGLESNGERIQPLK